MRDIPTLTERYIQNKADPETLRRYVLWMKDQDPEEAVSDITIMHAVCDLKRLSDYAREKAKSYAQLDIEDLREVRRRLDQEVSSGTIKGATAVRVRLETSAFLRWLHDDDKTPLAEAMDGQPRKKPRKGRRKTRQKVLDIYTPDELRMIFDSCLSVRDRALYKSLWESGARISEFLALKIGDVEFTQIPTSQGSLEMARLRIANPMCKTDERKVLLRESVSELRSWLRMHPAQDNPDSPLWITTSGEAVTATTIRNTLRFRITPRILRRHGHKLAKPGLHKFRHTRATQFASAGVDRWHLCEIFGWDQDSRMPGRYIHSAGVSAEDALLEAYGIKPDATRMEIVLKQVKCPNQECGFEAPEDFAWCPKCGSPLKEQSRKLAEAKEKEHEDMAKRISELEGKMTKWSNEVVLLRSEVEKSRASISGERVKIPRSTA